MFSIPEKVLCACWKQFNSQREKVKHIRLESEDDTTISLDNRTTSQSQKTSATIAIDFYSSNNTELFIISMLFSIDGNGNDVATSHDDWF